MHTTSSFITEALCPVAWGVSNHWIGIWMEWNDMIRNSKITKYAFSYSSIALQKAIFHCITGC